MTEANQPQALSEGQTIQWYRVEKVLGVGGFGITYLATDNNLDHRVAIKEYLPTALVERQSDKSLIPLSERAEKQYREGLDRFLSEARTLVKFRHKNIVRVMAVFEANSTAYLVMEYEEGERFKESVNQNGVDEQTLKSLLLDIIDGLEQVHQHGFIHRDIKPVNIIIRHDGSPVLLDFGASRVVNRDSAAPPTSFVSAGFTPLEQYQEGAGMEPGPWTDIYSLAATLYYAISGQIPVSAVSRLASFVKKSPDPLIPATEIGHNRYSNEFLEAIDWALQFKTSDRPQSLAQWRDAIVRTELSDRQRVRRVRSTRRSAVLGQPKSGRAPSGSNKWRWFVALPLILMIGAGSRALYLDVSQQSEIKRLLEQADIAFANDNYLEESRPLYVQVLSADSQNQRALERVEEIDRRTERFIATLIDDQKFELAVSTVDVYSQAQPERAGELLDVITEARSRLKTQEQLDDAEADIVAERYQDALLKLAELKKRDVAHDEVTNLEKTALTEIKRIEERQQVFKEKQLQNEQARLESQRRLAEANERQRRRRSDYRQYLNSARWALQNDNIETARKWFDSASAMQISDDELSDLKSRLEAAEKFLETPLSSYEISYARGQFNALKRAIELKNISAIEELVGSDSPRINLFKTLFKRYRQVTTRVFDVEPKLDPKRVTATLRIEKMALPNGDIVYPAASYRDSDLSIERQRFTWSAIQW